jgi:hypothetical protein
VPINFVNTNYLNNNYNNKNVNSSLDMLGRKSSNKYNKIKIDISKNGTSSKKIIIN